MDLEVLSRYFYLLFVEKGFEHTTSTWLGLGCNILVLGLIIIILDFISKKVFVTLFEKFAVKTQTKFDDFLVKNKTPDLIAHLIPLIVILTAIPYLFADFQSIHKLFKVLVDVFIVFLIIRIARSLFETVKDYLKTLDSFKDKPLDSYIQVIMIFIWFIGVMIIFSIITGQSVWKFVTAMGAASAVLLLIFKDTILGFVASIQVSVNDTVRIGDWITMNKYEADGIVTEINLASVKVQNFDKTITTIPTYYLISDAFKNWRGMTEADGRRIQRSLLIKTSSVRFLKDDELKDLSKIELIKGYINERNIQIQNYNVSNKIDKSILINGRNLSNIGLFKKYVELYVHQIPEINQSMGVFISQSPINSTGMPIQVTVFSHQKDVNTYNQIIADLFDHLLSSVSYFDLEIAELNRLEN